MITIIQLKYILAVAEHQNFTTAAEDCAVTQPTLSMQIRKLEDHIGVKIFNRSKKPIYLTEIGEKIVKQAKIIVDESNRIKDIVDQQKGYVGGEFKIAVIPTIMSTIVPMFLKSFSKKYPKVKLNIEELTTEEIIKKITKGNIDAAIAATPLENEKIKEIPLYHEPFLGFVPESHKLYKKKTLRINELQAEDLLLLKDGHCFKESILNICKPSVNKNSKNFELESGNFDTLIKLSKENLGMTLLPYLHTLDLNKQDQKLLREFEAPVPAREVSLIYYKTQFKIQLIQALKKNIDGLVKGAISFNDLKIISPLRKTK